MKGARGPSLTRVSCQLAKRLISLGISRFVAAFAPPSPEKRFSAETPAGAQLPDSSVDAT